MTLATLRTAPSAHDPADVLRQLIPADFLAAIGWDEERQVLFMPMDPPLLGWRACKVTGCGMPTRGRTHLCLPCERELAASGQDEAAFLASQRVTRRRGVGRCLAGCRRPWKSSLTPLCEAHLHRRNRTPESTLEEFLDPSLTPLPGFGECDVVACDRIRYGSKSGFCKAHGTRWGQVLQADPNLNRTTWCRLEPAIEEMNNITLRGLTPLAQAQVLYSTVRLCLRMRDQCENDFAGRWSFVEAQRITVWRSLHTEPASRVAREADPAS